MTIRGSHWVRDEGKEEWRINVHQIEGFQTDSDCSTIDLQIKMIVKSSKWFIFWATKNNLWRHLHLLSVLHFRMMMSWKVIVFFKRFQNFSFKVSSSLEIYVILPRRLDPLDVLDGVKSFEMDPFCLPSWKDSWRTERRRIKFRREERWNEMEANIRFK